MKILAALLLLSATTEAWAFGAPGSAAHSLGGEGQNGMSMFQHETMLQRERDRVRAEIAAEAARGGGNGGRATTGSVAGSTGVGVCGCH